MELVNPSRSNPVPPPLPCASLCLGTICSLCNVCLAGSNVQRHPEVHQKSFHLQFWACTGHAGSQWFPSMATLMLSAVCHSTRVIQVCPSSGGTAPPLLQIMECNCWAKLTLTYLHWLWWSYTEFVSLARGFHCYVRKLSVLCTD